MNKKINRFHSQGFEVVAEFYNASLRHSSWCLFSDPKCMFDWSVSAVLIAQPIHSLGIWNVCLLISFSWSQQIHSSATWNVCLIDISQLWSTVSFFSDLECMFDWCLSAVFNRFSDPKCILDWCLSVLLNRFIL